MAPPSRPKPYELHRPTIFLRHSTLDISIYSHVKACGISSYELRSSGSRASDAHLSSGCCDCEPRAQYNEKWTIHRVNDQTSITRQASTPPISCFSY
ncbi:hypothetical protein F2P79_005906 [Pimephales promelas]|nr:hypothetical protein F2P79_005906 [Pimephales promelas]